MAGENNVLDNAQQRSVSLLEDRAASRVRDRQAVYEDELDALVQAAFAVVARTGSFDASVREILKEAGLSNQAFYRHVAGKDELLLLMLDEGRRSLVRYLDHQMLGCPDASARLATWIRGVLAQAGDAETARRTRPFVAQVDRLAELFPDEQRRSEDLLVDQLAIAASLSAPAATAVYDLAFGALARHLRRGTPPSAPDTDALIEIARRLAHEENS